MGRLAAFVLTLAATAATTLVLPMLRPPTRRRLVRTMARACLAALGIRIDGKPLPGNAKRTGRLIVCNHISWLDILAVLAVAPALLVAKREVAGWPVIGALARRTGTLFIDRSRLRALPYTIEIIAAELKQGNDVVVFPEGTTWCGVHTGRWYPAAFEAAIRAAAVIQPLHLTYRTPQASPATAVAFLGDENLVSCLGRISAMRGLFIDIIQPVPYTATVFGRSSPAAARRELARLATPTPPVHRPPRTVHAATHRRSPVHA